MIGDTVSQLISYDTSRGNTDAVRASFGYIRNFLGSTHFDFEYIEHNDVVSLIIFFKGRNWKEEKILLNGHIDVVPGSLEQFTSRIAGDRLYGRGAVDMKGGIAAMIHALKDLSEQQIFPSVACVITSDEEIGGQNGAGYICEQYDFNPDFVLVPDGPCKDCMEITNREKGIAWIKLEAAGTSCHASRPWLGDNAVDHVLTSIINIKQLFGVSNDKGWHTTASVTYIHTDNDTYNKVPSSAEAMLDIRFTEADALHPDELLEKIRPIVPTQVDVSLCVSGAPVFVAEDNPYILKLKKYMTDVSGQDIAVTYSDAGHDARYFAGKGIPTALIGPVGDNWHAEDEYVDVSSVDMLRDTLVSFLKDIG